MPVVKFSDRAQHAKAIGVLIEEGGTFSFSEGRELSVTGKQYEALVKAGVVAPKNNAKRERKRVPQKKARS